MRPLFSRFALALITLLTVVSSTAFIFFKYSSEESSPQRIISSKLSTAQNTTTINATGTMWRRDDTRFSVPVTMVFSPIGGDVIGYVDWQFTETQGDGSVLYIDVDWSFEGIYDGGNGGAVYGDMNGIMTVTGYPDFVYSGTWGGNFHADGTGSGVYDAQISAAGETSSGQFVWDVTFSAADFAVALLQIESEEPTAKPNQPEVVVVPQETRSPDTAIRDSSFEESWQSDQAKAIREPLISAVGGLIGAGIAWLMAKGAAQTSQYAATITNPVSSTAQVLPPIFTTEPPVLTSSPPQLLTEPPPIQTTLPVLQTEPPPIDPSGESPYELGFNLVKDAVGGTATTLDLFKDYFSVSDSPKTVEAIRKAVRAWRAAPNPETAANYLKTLRNSNSLKMDALSEKLGVVGKGLDMVEAANKAYKICQDRGYSGLDAAMTMYAEAGKKALVWGITKNPVIGLADTAIGNTTQLLLGAENKVDISVLVDKSTEAWDKVTQEAAQIYNQGFEETATNYRAETLNSLTSKIKKLVADGKITKQEGIQRLKTAIDRFNQETPKL